MSITSLRPCLEIRQTPEKSTMRKDNQTRIEIPDTSTLTHEMEIASEIILLSDPNAITGEVYIDYGDPDRPRFLCSPADDASFAWIANRYFDLMDILVGDIPTFLRSPHRASRITINLDLDMGAVSAHKRLTAAGKLRTLLEAKGIEPRKIEGFLDLPL